MSKSYVLLRGGKPYGPYSINQIKMAISQGKLQPNDLLSVKADGVSQPAAQYPELVPLFQQFSSASNAAPQPPAGPAPQPVNSIANIANPYWLNQDTPANANTAADPAKIKKPFKLDPVMLIGGGLLGIGGLGALFGLLYFTVFSANAWNDMQEETRRNIDAISSQRPPVIVLPPQN